MKIKLMLTGLLALGVLSSCKQTQSTDDPQILASVLQDYFDGVRNRDVNKLKAVTTDDFVLFEDGRVWTNDSLINSLSAFKSVRGTIKPDNMKINVDHSSGDVTYFNHADFIINDTIPMKFNWIESATFRKVDGKWKMNFLHSTVRK